MLATLYLAFSLQALSIYANSDCQSFHTSFADLDGFTPISQHETYGIGANGLELYLRKPEGTIKTADGMNDKISDGATVNSTFVFGQVLLHTFSSSRFY